MGTELGWKVHLDSGMPTQRVTWPHQYPFLHGRWPPRWCLSDIQYVEYVEDRFWFKWLVPFFLGKNYSYKAIGLSDTTGVSCEFSPSPAHLGSPSLLLVLGLFLRHPWQSAQPQDPPSPLSLSLSLRCPPVPMALQPPKAAPPISPTARLFLLDNLQTKHVPDRAVSRLPLAGGPGSAVLLLSLSAQRHSYGTPMTSRLSSDNWWLTIVRPAVRVEPWLEVAPCCLCSCKSAAAGSQSWWYCSGFCRRQIEWGIWGPKSCAWHPLILILLHSRK